MFLYFYVVRKLTTTCPVIRDRHNSNIESHIVQKVRIDYQLISIAQRVSFNNKNNDHEKNIFHYLHPAMDKHCNS